MRRPGALAIELAWVWLVGIGGCAAAAANGPSPARCEDCVMRWEAGAPTVQRQIEHFLSGRELIVQREKMDGSEVLVLLYEGQRTPDFLIIVNVAEQPRYAGDVQPRQFLVTVNLKTFASVPERLIDVTLQSLNDFNLTWAYGAFCLSGPEREVVGMWPIRMVEGEPFALDAVYHAIVMLVENWLRLHPALLPPAEPSPSSPGEPEPEAEPEPEEEPPPSPPPSVGGVAHSSSWKPSMKPSAQAVEAPGFF